MAKRHTNPLETELKLRLSQDAGAVLERAPAFAGTAVEQRRQTTQYFDTPELALAANGFTLRIRNSGKLRVQTLKTTASEPGSASRRGEWEWEVEGTEPALDRLAETPAAAVVPDLARRLRPVFLTEIERRARRVRIDAGTEIEAAHDRGRIVADDADEPVDELELELKQGAPGALYRLAIALHATVPMRLAPESKAARGYRLRTGRAPQAVHAPKLRLRRKVRANDALRAIVGGGIGGILANVAAAEAGEPEGIHQLRVGLRRLRSALVLFAPMLEPNATRLFTDELRRLGRVFGARRDRDVFCLETLPALVENGPAGWIGPLRTLAERDREAAQLPVREALHSPGLTSLALGLAAWCEDGVMEPGLLGDKRWGKRLDAVAPGLLDRLARKVAKRAQRIDRPERLHDLRKSLKKLHYATDFVGSLYGRKAVKRYRNRCQALQELLGTINDARVTPRLAESLVHERSLELAPAIAALSAWSVKRERTARRHLRGALRGFEASAPFWQ